MALKVQKGQALSIEAKGKWRVLPGGKVFGPAHSQFYLRGRLDDGKPFRVGGRFTLLVEKDGVLHLGMKEGGIYSNNSGSITVTIRVDKEQPTRTIRISFDSPRVAAQSLQYFYTPDPSKWQVAKGRLVARGRPASKLTYKTWFQEITRVTITGGIVLPSNKNFRVAIGPLNLIFNSELGTENRYGLAEHAKLASHKGHALTPGKVHVIVVEQTGDGDKVVVSVDRKTVYTTKTVLHGTVTVYPAFGNTIGIVGIEIVGKPDPNREVRGPSHRAR